jgi:hypothetical protein
MFDRPFADPVPDHLAGIKYETGQVAKAHENVARNLDSLIIKPFTTWSHQHEGRISELKDQLNDSIRDWEDFQNEASPVNSLLLCYFANRTASRSANSRMPEASDAACLTKQRTISSLHLRLLVLFTLRLPHRALEAVAEVPQQLHLWLSRRTRLHKLHKQLSRLLLQHRISLEL